MLWFCVWVSFVVSWVGVVSVGVGFECVGGFCFCFDLFGLVLLWWVLLVFCFSFYVCSFVLLVFK